LPLPADPELGSTYYTIGLIEGGVAPNVVSPHASAEIMFRIVGSPDDVLRAIAPLCETVRIEEVLRVDTVRLHTPDGFTSAVFAFTTDVPLLGAWGTPLLFGPGSILVAHTDEEYVAIDERGAAIETYQRLVRRLLS
jgi:acetylornithine deacetylase